MADIDYTKFGVHAATFQTLIPQIEATAAEHDDLVSQLSVKEGQVSDEILENARLRNKSGNARVAKINSMITRALAEIEKLKLESYELVEDDVPQPLTEEERPKVQARVKELRDTYKTQLEAINTVAGAIQVSLDGVELPSIMANGRRTGGTGTGHSGIRLHVGAVYVNGDLSFKPRPHKPGETMSSLSTAATDINSKVGTGKVSASDLQKRYFEAAGISPDENGNIDRSKLPKDMQFTYRYVDGENVQEFEIRVVREAEKPATNATTTEPVKTEAKTEAKA